MASSEDHKANTTTHKQISEIEAMLETHRMRGNRNDTRSARSGSPRYPDALLEPERTMYGSPKPMWEQWGSLPSKNVQGETMIKNTHTPPPFSKGLHATAYLDGLRGFAALLVYILHNQVWARVGVEQEEVLENAFGWKNHYHLATFPWIRLLFSGGHAGVPVFFIISGYVLVHKPLGLLLQKGNIGAVADNMCSALFRRWLRLYLPVAITTLLWAASWHLFGIQTSLPGMRKPEENISDEVWMWYCDFKNISFVFNDKLMSMYNPNMWTIPLEFRGSILVWTSILAFGKFTHLKRLTCEVGLFCYFLFVVDAWYLALFMAGVIYCDLDHLTRLGRVPSPFTSITKTQPKWLLWTLFLIGTWFAGIPSVAMEPERLRQQPGWYYLSYLKPQAVWDIRNFYRTVAALLIVYCVPRLAPVKRCFESDVCQYLGRISFSLYLVHGPVLWSIGDRVYAAVGRIQPHQIGVIPGWINAFRFPDVGLFGLEFNTLVAQLILLPLTFGIAEVVSNFIDATSVTFASKTYKWMAKGSSTDGGPELLKRHDSGILDGNHGHLTL